MHNMTSKSGRDGKRQRVSPSPAAPSDNDLGSDAGEDPGERAGAGARAGGSASATPAPPDFNEEDWFLPLDPPFKLPPPEARPQGKKRGGGASAHGGERRHPPPPKRWLRLRQLLQSEGYDELPASAPTFSNMEAPPSTYPPKRYCDLTGLEAPYVDPKTGLRYAGAQLFGYLRALPPDNVQARLALRRAEVILK